ncbi:MAG: UDP-N-acetylmuramate dehydrogenase [Acidobacteria bacterium]|nr:UDP-N-acetylmuramate dehydrogenase [Acidobacteriota bacterium]
MASYTRFGIGGAADVFAETSDAGAFAEALGAVRASGEPYVVMGGGTNLVVADDGFRGIVLRLAASGIRAEGGRVTVESGAVLQALVDFTVDRGLQGLETLAGIPGWVGAAVYGNAGAYGHSISERVAAVTFLDGIQVRTISGGACGFRYRESVFKRRKDWIIVSAELDLDAGQREELRKTAGDIVAIRNEKFPPSMKCAGSIFKNLLLAELPAAVAAQVPAKVVREGKIPAAYFLEQVGAKGMRRGGIEVAGYHANLVYNAGQGTASELRALLGELKERVRVNFGLVLEEEVQYVGL